MLSITHAAFVFLIIQDVVLCSSCASNQEAHVNCTFVELSETTPICGYQHHDDIGIYWERVEEKTSAQYASLGIEPTTDERVHGIWTDVTSPPVLLEGPVCIVFQYLNQVCLRGGLRPSFTLYIQRSREERIFIREYYCVNTTAPVAGNHRELKTYSELNIWLAEEVQFEARPDDRLVFSGIQHGEGEGEIEQYIRVDDVSVYPGLCPAQLSGDRLPGDCDFESPDLCGYTQQETGTQWRLVRQENLYDRLDDVSKAPHGYFLAVTPGSAASDNGFGKYSSIGAASVSITSPTTHLSKNGCIRFRYRNAPSAEKSVSAMTVSLTSVNGKWTEDDPLPVTYGNGVWATRYVDAPAGRFNITIKAELDADFDNYVAFDSVEVFGEDCESVRCMADPCQVYKLNVICGGVGVSQLNSLERRCTNHGKKFLSCSDRKGYKRWEKW